MAENLVINGVTYPGVERLELDNTDGEKVLYFQGQPVNIVQGAGESESNVMSQKAVTDLVADAMGTGGSQYETVDSVEEMTDISKQYVLSSTGTVWAYTEKQEFFRYNAYDPATAKLNYRINSSHAEVACSGSLLLDYVEQAYDTGCVVTISGIDALAFNYSSHWVVDYYDASKTWLKQLTDGNFGTPDGSIPATFSLFKPTNGQSDIANTAYVRIRLAIKPDGTNMNASDVEGLVVNFNTKDGYETVSGWVDTGMTPSSVGVSGNYVTLLVKVEQNKADISEVSKRVTALETGSETLTIPSFWKNAVDSCISKIKALQVGIDCITFPFFSDNHQRNGYAGMLIAHIMQACHIPYCFYGGDSISNGTIMDEAEMIAQDKAFDAIMAYVPNGRLCRAVGNHDGYWYDGTNKYYYNRAQVYELFLREEAIAQNKHFGSDGTYYYVDDLASKTRWVVLNTNGGSVDSVQLTWLQTTALVFDAPGWSVVLISHQPLSNHYHAGIGNASEVIAAISGYVNGNSANKAAVVGCFSGHIHRDRIYTGLATNTSDDSQGADLPFTQVTITSDHTTIAYDDATKHTVANDDQSHAIDFVTINKATRTVSITRLGIGEDRSFTY